MRGSPDMASRTDYEIFDLGDFTLSGGAIVEEARTASRIGKKPGASFNPSRLRARSSCTVSKNPS
jgi:hypothetical protein